MTCEEALLAISAALDGELPPEARARLSEHLMQCESCRELAEDLRVLTNALEDSNREPPAGLAESVRKAVAEQPQPVPDRKRRRPPYLRGRLGLRSLAALLALCVGLGAIGLFATGQGGGETGSAAVRFQSAQAPPGAMEKSAPGVSDGASGGGAAGYSATEDGDQAEAPMEPADAEAPQPAPASVPMPSIAPSPHAAAGTYNYGGTEEDTPESGSDGGGPTSDSTGPTAGNGGFGSVRMEGEEKLTITPEEALELVFEHLGGYEAYPEALLYDTASGNARMLGYSLRTVETEAVRSEYRLHYVGLTDDGKSYEFHLYEDMTDKTDGGGHTATTNWIEVSLDGGEITAMF